MQTVTLIIDKRRELSVKYKKLLENDYSKVIISKNLLTALKIIQDTEPDLILISDSIDSDLADYCKKIRALTYNMRFCGSFSVQLIPMALMRCVFPHPLGPKIK